MMKKFIFTFSICHFIFSICHSQLPDCNIWLLDIKDSAGKISFSNPANITNRKGYDNQPAFSPDGKYILYSSQRDIGGATDIYKYNLKTKQTTQFTETSTSEYSPAFMPDGKNISVVMVEKDSAQRLWKFPIKGEKPGLIMDKIDSIGYYCWINKDSVALFLITTPFSLVVANIKIQKPTLIAKEVGRCIINVRNEKTLYFTTKDTLMKKWRLMQCYYGDTNKILFGNIFSAVLNGEDFGYWRGSIIAFNGSHFLMWVERDISAWIELTDISSFGITNISRIAFSPDGKKIAVVSNK